MGGRGNSCLQGKGVPILHRNRIINLKNPTFWIINSSKRLRESKYTIYIIYILCSRFLAYRNLVGVTHTELEAKAEAEESQVHIAVQLW